MTKEGLVLAVIKSHRRVEKSGVHSIFPQDEPAYLDGLIDRLILKGLVEVREHYIKDGQKFTGYYLHAVEQKIEQMQLFDIE